MEYFFRDQGEDYDVSTLDGLPLAQIHGKSWLDSLTIDDDKRTDRRVDLDLDGDGKVEADELETGMQHWQALRDAGLETMDYEDWIRTFGVAVPEVESSFNKYRPELVRYFRQWTYPTNTIDPATGKPSSAVSWINSFRADKDRLFKEPGFLVGLTVQKPKTYIKDTTGGLSSFLETIENWLPALSHSDYEKGFKQFAHGAGPLADKIGSAGPGYHGYWVDLRDLLVHGDQFINFAPDTASSALSVLTGDGKNRYPVASEIDNLFAGAAPDNILTTDGVVDLLIHGRQRDRTSGPVL